MTGFYVRHDPKQCGAELDPRGEDELVEDPWRGFHYAPRNEAEAFGHCGWLNKSQEPCDESEVALGEDDFWVQFQQELEDEKRVASAVAHAMELAEFFRRRKDAEEAANEPTFEAMCVAMDARRLRRLEAEFDASYGVEPATYEPPLPEVELVERPVKVRRSYSIHGQNRGWRVRTVQRYVKKAGWRTVWDDKLDRYVLKFDTWPTLEFLGKRTAQAQRCHGGADTRRYRRGDVSGKIIGGHHSRGGYDSDADATDVAPVVAIIRRQDGTMYRLRVG